MTPIFCPVCKRLNDSNATVCAFCNASLDTARGEHNTTANVETGTNVLSEAIESAAIRDLTAPDQGIAIYDSTNNPKPITIQESRVIILGRKKLDTQPEGFVDLTLFGGYEGGVSGRHAMVRKIESGYEILDLGSTNGTWLNRKRMLPNHPYPLESGAQVHLGRLCLFLVFKTG